MAKPRPNYTETLIPGGQQSQPAQPQAQPGRKRKEPTKAIGVNLTVSEWENIEQIRAELGLKRSQLLSYAVRKFIKDYEAGTIIETKRGLKDI